MSIKKNFIYNFLLTGSTLLFPIIIFPYISRILGPEGVGKIQFVSTFAQYFVLIASFGIPIYGTMEVTRKKGNKRELSKLFSELIGINFIATIILLIIYLTIILFFGWFQNNLFLYFLGTIMILSGFMSVDWIFIGLEEFRYLFIRSIIIKTISLIILFVFVKTHGDLIIYFVINIFSIVGNNIWNLIALKSRVSFQCKSLNLKKHLPILLTIFITNMSTSIYTMMDTLLLGFMSNDVAVGYYTAAIKLNRILIPLIVSLGIVLIPKITQSISFSDNGLTLKKLVNQSFSFICLLGIPVSLGLYIYAPEIMIVFSGKQFSNAVHTMQIASPLVFIIGIGHICGVQLLMPSGNEKYYLVATVFGLFTSLILNLYLIKLFNDKGAAAATVIGELVVTFLCYIFVYNRLKIAFNWKLVINACIASVMFFPIAFILRSFYINPVILLPVAVTSSACIYFIIQLLMFKEKLTQKSVFKLITIIRFSAG